MEQRQVREKPTKELEKDGCLWQNKLETERNLCPCKSETEKRTKLKIQMKFHEKFYA